MAKNKYYIEEDIRDVLFSEDENYYENKINKIRDIIINDVTTRTKKCLIRFNDNIKKEITLGNYLTYLIMFEPHYIFEEEPDDDDVVDVRNINNFEKYLDNVIKKFKLNRNINLEDEEENQLVGRILIDIINQLSKISCETIKNYAPSFDMKQFIDLADRNPEFAKILYEPEFITSEFNAKEIIAHTNKVIKDVERIICEDDDNTFKYFVMSGAGVNMKQLGQVLGYIGLKPDLKEKIIPHPIQSNFCMGMKSVKDFYVNSIGCLKALITSHIQVKNSGYFTRKLEILLNDEFLNMDVEDCGTKHLLPFNITDIKQFEHLNERWYSEYPSGRKLKKIDTENNDYSDYLNKTIYLRDPITCACKKGICKKCYGDLWKVVYDMNIGIIACLILTNEFTQTMLSTKHLLQAKLKQKEYSASFLEYFEFDLDKIVLKSNYDKVSIEFEEFDDNDTVSLNRFVVVDGNERIIIETEMPLTINEELIEDLSSKLDKDEEVYILKPKDLQNLDYIFSFVIDNDGLSRTMLAIKNLIDKKEFIEGHNIYEVYDKFIELVAESGSIIDYVHISVILRNMMKVIDGNEQFAKDEEPLINLYKISDAIHYCSDSVSKPLLFEQINKHLTTDSYGTMNKCGYSSHDELLK